LRDFKVQKTEEQGTEGRRRGNSDGSPGEFDVTYQPMNNGVYRIYLNSQIEHAGQFTGALEVFARASEHDVVEVHLSTPGGSLDATDTFLQGMRECQARVIVKATGGVHSAGSIILLSADEFILSENFNCLIHNGSCGSGGKFSDFVAESDAAKEYMQKVMRNTYEGFLTEQEIEDLMRGRDFWLNGKQFMERWHRREELRQEADAQQQQDMMGAFAEQMRQMGMALPAPAPAPAKKTAPKRKTKKAAPAAVIQG
jgi:ATP-dependent protease ClpP protease subunit